MHAYRPSDGEHRYGLRMANTPFKWFMICDDDTFVNLPKLEEVLARCPLKAMSAWPRFGSVRFGSCAGGSAAGSVHTVLACLRFGSGSVFHGGGSVQTVRTVRSVRFERFVRFIRFLNVTFCSEFSFFGLLFFVFLTKSRLFAVFRQIRAQIRIPRGKIVRRDDFSSKTATSRPIS